MLHHPAACIEMMLMPTHAIKAAASAVAKGHEQAALRGPEDLAGGHKQLTCQFLKPAMHAGSTFWGETCLAFRCLRIQHASDQSRYPQRLLRVMPCVGYRILSGLAVACSLQQGVVLRGLIAERSD